jgi:hypothetical protein
VQATISILSALDISLRSPLSRIALRLVVLRERQSDSPHEELVADLISLIAARPPPSSYKRARALTGL